VKNDQPNFKISKSGFDVLTATDDQLIFNSSQDVLKVAKTDTASLSINFPSHTGTAGNDIATVTIPHNLGFIPIAQVFQEDILGVADFRRPIGSGSIDPSNIGFNINPLAQVIVSYYDISTDIDNLYISYTRCYAMGSGFSTGTQVESYTFKYYLLQETAN